MKLIISILIACSAAALSYTTTASWSAPVQSSVESSPPPQDTVIKPAPRPAFTPVSTPISPRTLVGTDFGFPGVRTQSQNNKSATGPLVFPWRDASGWGKLWVTYALKHEGGRRFQRVYVSRLVEGRAQLIHALPVSFPRRALTLDMEVKGTPGLSLFLGIRQQNAPFDYAWANAIVLTKVWRSVQWRIPPLQPNQPLMLIFEIPREGTFDIGRCKLVELNES